MISIELKQKYQAYPDDKLLSIVNSDENTYTSEAMEIAKMILFERGYSSTFDQHIKDAIEVLPDEELLRMIDSERKTITKVKREAVEEELIKRGYTIKNSDEIEQNEANSGVSEDIGYIKDLKPMTPVTKAFIKAAGSGKKNWDYIGVLMIFTVGIYFIFCSRELYRDGSDFFTPLLIIGLVTLAISGLLVRSVKNSKTNEYWIDVLEKGRPKVVWVQPTKVNHKAAYVFTLYSHFVFTIHTADYQKVSFTCGFEEDVDFFYSIALQYFPNAHLGYTKDTEMLFLRNAEAFIDKLNSYGEYKPIALVIASEMLKK
ncbi:hypothetical protein [Lewinella sp. LCG006]|uniref:hypothetical protein n=1 Tax=Lewinella sp. LCG006 TaxID=3231911 RepID=UPI003460BBF5